MTPLRLSTTYNDSAPLPQHSESPVIKFTASTAACSAPSMEKLTLIPFNRFYFAFFILKLTETKGEFTFFSGHDWRMLMQKIILSAEKKFTYTNRCNLLIILLNFGSLLEVIEKKNKFFNWRIHLKHVSYQFPRFKICFDENFFLKQKKDASLSPITKGKWWML